MTERQTLLKDFIEYIKCINTDYKSNYEITNCSVINSLICNLCWQNTCDLPFEI